MSERNGIWARILSVVIPMMVAGLIAWGSLRSDVEHAAAAIEKKADQSTVNVQYEALLREMQGVNQRLDRMERKP
jgi:hypothetical protein